MAPQSRISTHPGTILLKEFFEPMKLAPKHFADYLGIPVQRINEIVRGKKAISPDTVWLLPGALDTSPEFWLNLQTMHDTSANRPEKQIKPIKTVMR